LLAILRRIVYLIVVLICTTLYLPPTHTYFVAKFLSKSFVYFLFLLLLFTYFLYLIVQRGFIAIFSYMYSYNIFGQIYPITFLYLLTFLKQF
jgi:hypothetical protein